MSKTSEVIKRPVGRPAFAEKSKPLFKRVPEGKFAILKAIQDECLSSPEYLAAASNLLAQWQAHKAQIRL